MKKLHRVLIVLLCIVCLGLPLELIAATYNSASNAYERRDYSTAIQEFTELAQNNDGYAQYMLGKIYATGEAGQKDYVAAYKWLCLAENNGVSSAGKLKRKVSKKMSRQQVFRAKQLVDEWPQGAITASQSSEILDPAVVRKVQQELYEQGYFFDKIDGLVGGRTRNGIRRYQQAAELVEDGKITPELLDSLHLSGSYVISSPEFESEGGEQKLTALQRKLRRIILRAKETGAAEPWLIRKLERLAGDERTAWSNMVLQENFMDENYQGGSDWQVMAGNFQLERGTGLIVTPQNNWGAPSNTLDDLTSQLLGASMSQKQLQQATRRFAKIQKKTHHTKSFALQVRTGPLNNTEGLIFSSSHAGAPESGYRLVLQQNQGHQRVQAKLFKVDGNTPTEIKTFSNRVIVEDTATHAIKWTCTPKGLMTVSIDGQVLLQVTSSGVREAFENLGIAHLGNQVVLQDIKLLDSGTHSANI